MCLLFMAWVISSFQVLMVIFSIEWMVIYLPINPTSSWPGQFKLHVGNDLISCIIWHLPWWSYHIIVAFAPCVDMLQYLIGKESAKFLEWMKLRIFLILRTSWTNMDILPVNYPYPVVGILLIFWNTFQIQISGGISGDNPHRFFRVLHFIVSLAECEKLSFNLSKVEELVADYHWLCSHKFQFIYNCFFLRRKRSSIHWARLFAVTNTLVSKSFRDNSFNLTSFLTPLKSSSRNPQLFHAHSSGKYEGKIFIAWTEPMFLT